MAQPPKKSNRIQGLANYSKTEHGEFEEFIDKYEAEAIKDGITTYRAQRELLPTYAPCMKDLLLLHKAKLDPATDWAGFKQAWIQATKPPQYLQNQFVATTRYNAKDGDDVDSVHNKWTSAMKQFPPNWLAPEAAASIFRATLPADIQLGLAKKAPAKSVTEVLQEAKQIEDSLKMAAAIQSSKSVPAKREDVNEIDDDVAPVDSDAERSNSDSDHSEHKRKGKSNPKRNWKKQSYCKKCKRVVTHSERDCWQCDDCHGYGHRAGSKTCSRHKNDTDRRAGTKRKLDSDQEDLRRRIETLEAASKARRDNAQKTHKSDAHKSHKSDAKSRRHDARKARPSN